MGDSDDCWETIDDGDDCWETIDDEDDDYFQDDDSGQENNDSEEVSAEAIQTFRCVEPGCPKIFSSRFRLVRHILIQTAEPRYQCTICDCKFRYKDQYKKHLKVHKPRKQKDKPKKKKEVQAETSKPIACMQPGCPERFSSKLELVKHIVIKSREKSFKCPSCGCCFDPKDQLKNHLEQCIRSLYKA